MLAKQLKIERPSPGSTRGWRMLPGAEHIAIWEMSEAGLAGEPSEAGGKRYIFHVDYVHGVTRGCRATYFGDHYSILEVSDSSVRLRGLELRCEKQE